MAVRTFGASKDVAVRASGASWSDTPREGTGAKAHLYAGRLPKRLHRSFIDFAYDFDNVAVIQSADLVLTTSEVDNEVGSEARAKVFRVTAEWTEGGHSDWHAGDDINPPVATGRSWSGQINGAPQGESRIDITALVGMWAPKSVRWLDGGGVRQPGGDLGRHGLRLQADGEQDADHGFEVWSQEAPTSSRRPYIEIVYQPVNLPPDIITTISPDGTVLPGVPFTGEFSDPDGDRPEKIQVQVFRVSNGNKVWDQTFPFDPLWVLGGGGFWEWSVANPGPSKLKADIAYEWRAKGFDKRGKETDWTAPRAFTQSGTAPVITLVPLPDSETLVGTQFVMQVEAFDGAVPASVRIQLASTTSSWEPSPWDEVFLPLTPQEVASGVVSRPYGGSYLAAGSWDWRAMVFDSLGRASDWSDPYDTFVLSVGSEVDQDGGGAGPPPNTTGYARVRGPVRVVLRDMAANRGPGTIKAIIEDPANLGCSAYVNEPGELYFTLPATHPQAGECEPYQRHYAVQQYRNGNWRDIANGILTDFDASADDIVVYGIDYLGFLSLSIDTRFPEGEPPPVEEFNKDVTKGGSRYKDKAIDFIIEDQLQRAIDDVDSPLGFFHIGNIDDLTAGGLLKVSIYASFVQRLDFIRGLLDSYRQGTGVRSRLKARKDPSQADRWEFDVRADPGIDRDNLRMEYGSLVQGFRVIGFGDTFATRAHGIGREPYSTNLRYTLYPPTGSGDSLTGTYGNIAKAQVWQDIIDRNDLKRRVRQLYQESIKVGKRIALGLRVHSLQPWDGFDLTDNIPLNIDRGMVDTEAYGSGYWTIWGQEWRVFPDGHDELTLVIRPKEDGEPADPDLLPSKPGPGKDWCVGHGPPTGDMICACVFYLDIDSGIIYPCPEEPEPPITPTVWKAEYLLFDDFDRTTPLPCWQSEPFAGIGGFESGCIIMGVTQGYTSGTSHPIDVPDGSGGEHEITDRKLVIFAMTGDEVGNTSGGMAAGPGSPWNTLRTHDRSCTHTPFVGGGNDAHPSIQSKVWFLDVDANPDELDPTGAVLTLASAVTTQVLWVAVLMGGVSGAQVGPSANDWDLPAWDVPHVVGGPPTVPSGKQLLYLSVAFDRAWSQSEHPETDGSNTPEAHDTSIPTGLPSGFQRVTTAVGGDKTILIDVALSPVATGAGVPVLDPTAYDGTGGAQKMILTGLYGFNEA